MSLMPWTAFVTVCRLGSMAAAASELGYTQSAVSRQVATLERELAVPLVHRLARGVQPTAAGRAVLPHARAVLGDVERARRSARDAGDARPNVAIGAVPSAAVSLVPAALGVLAGAVRCSMVTGLTPQLVERVDAGELDLAVVTDAPPGIPATDLTLRRLFDDPMAVVLPQAHPHAHAGGVGLVDLTGATWIEDNPGSEGLLRELALRVGAHVAIERSTDDLTTKIALVAAGQGVALVPRSLEATLRPDVRLVDLHDAPIRGIYVIAARGRDDLDDVVAALAAVTPGRDRRPIRARADDSAGSLTEGESAVREGSADSAGSAGR